MRYHFLTQPLPTAVGRRVQVAMDSSQWSIAIAQALTLSALFVEVAVPVGSMAVCRSEAVDGWAAGSCIILQAFIAATGHFGSSSPPHDRSSSND